MPFSDNYAKILKNYYKKLAEYLKKSYLCIVKNNTDMKKVFEPMTLENGVNITFKAIANLRDRKITIYKRYDYTPFTKAFVSTILIKIADIYEIMYLLNTKELASWIMQNSGVAGKLRKI